MLHFYAQEDKLTRTGLFSLRYLLSTTISSSSDLFENNPNKANIHKFLKMIKRK